MRTIATVLFFLPFYLNAQENAPVIPLWPNGAPGFENKKNEKEEAKEWWVKNVHNPSLEVFLPEKNIANGAAVVICPGGGHRVLVYDAEGRDAARFFTKMGVAAFVLKYRLYREEKTLYKVENVQQDIFRAMRLVKSKAGEFNLDTTRIGVMGFSAGGEVAGWVSYHFAEQHYASSDAVDQLNARPAFEILIYPGPQVVPDSVLPTAPAAFLLAANDDECCSEPIVKLLEMHRKSKVPVEVHLYQQGNHAFNMGARTTLQSIKNWPRRLSEWLNDNGWLKK